MLINYKDRKKTKCISLILCLLLLCLLSGCRSRKTADESEDSQIILTPEPTSAVGDSDETEEVDTNKNEVTIAPLNPSETTEEPKLEDFSELDKYFKGYTFDVSYDEKLEYYQRTYDIHGEYDLDGDGEADRINIVLRSDCEDGSYIEVMGIKLALNPENPSGEVQIIDLDNRDSYVEVAVFDNGPSGDPNFSFFRYDGKEFYSIGSIDRFALMDGQGKFISWFYMANYFKPKFHSAWGELKDNKYVITNHDVKQYIGKTYEVDGTGYFVPLDKNPEDYFDYMVWDPEVQREFKAMQIKLLDIHISPNDRVLNWFYVELPDGEKGLLYFWIGD